MTKVDLSYYNLLMYIDYYTRFKMKAIKLKKPCNYDFSSFIYIECNLITNLNFSVTLRQINMNSILVLMGKGRKFSYD